jgi:exosome complex component RRP45
MPRAAEPSLNEREFILQALRQNLRLDNREFDAYRKLELTFGDEYGVADVRLGKTRSVRKSVFGESELMSKQSRCSHIM